MAAKKKQNDIEEIAFEIGGDNVFADIGVANAEEELPKPNWHGKLITS
jgi:hypothetical protein